MSCNRNYWTFYYYYNFKYLTSFFKFKKWISAVFMNQRCIHESALYHIALIRNQQCIRQCWFRISAVWYSPDSELALYPTILISVFKGMFFPNHFSFEAISAVGWFGLSAVSDNTDSELALYPTALIRNQRCIWQRWIFTFKHEYLHEFETKFENILGCESGAHMGSIHV